MHDRIVFVEIAHALVRPAFDVTAANVGVFQDIFSGDVTYGFEPVTSCFPPRTFALQITTTTLRKQHRKFDTQSASLVNDLHSYRAERV